MPRGPVLVVEDHEDARQALVELLRECGFPVQEARHGAEALALVRTERPAVVLLDLMMPVMDGWEFLRALAAEPSLASIPFAVISAIHEGEQGRLALSPSAYFNKPFSPPDLVRFLEDYSPRAARR